MVHVIERKNLNHLFHELRDEWHHFRTLPEPTIAETIDYLTKMSDGVGRLIPLLNDAPPAANILKASGTGDHMSILETKYAQYHRQYVQPDTLDQMTLGELKLASHDITSMLETASKMIHSSLA
ncbi:hypothetical protein J5289_16220 [Rhizobium sp. B230/85]|uniref:hypothetical protein n=1 Tax=Rhizobium sp. B230/85 TaxID=2819994 RepID=UPI001B0DB1D7|nr:hypothetical protein [Rhizobium sp. B230/85]MBO9131730.1 hypothetical protein [Rhizobium sp. B209b/85]QXZ95702.1 hypothetical protein J5289_16220 [Rhizobium sp. B230/85]